MMPVGDFFQSACRNDSSKITILYFPSFLVCFRSSKLMAENQCVKRLKTGKVKTAFNIFISKDDVKFS